MHMQTNLSLLKLKTFTGLAKKIPGESQIGKFRVVYPSERAFYFEYRDIFEKEIYKFKALHEKPRIIDAGGYIGMATLYFKKLYPGTIIKVFEQDPFALSFLKRNIKNNNIKNVSIYNIGLGKNKERASLYLDDGDGASAKIKNEKEQVGIKIEKLSDYISSAPIDLLKMNIEGAEYEVLQDIESKLGSIDQIIMEYHCFYELPQTLGKILEILNRNSFRYAVSSSVGHLPGNPFVREVKPKLFNLIYAKKI